MVLILQIHCSCIENVKWAKLVNFKFKVERHSRTFVYLDAMIHRHLTSEKKKLFHGSLTKGGMCSSSDKKCWWNSEGEVAPLENVEMF